MNGLVETCRLKFLWIVLVISTGVLYNKEKKNLEKEWRI